MGSNTYTRRYWNDNELKELIQKINGFNSLFNDKIYDDEKKWRAHISRHLDTDSCNRFFFMLEDTTCCYFCKAELGIESYSYTGWNRGFSKYCPTCTSNAVWRTKECLGADKLAERGKVISAAKKEYYKTEAGKQAAQKSSILNAKLMKEKILSGKFTPNSNNRNTHWGSSYKEKNYRSSWEAVYQYHYPDAEYESLRIPYKFQGKECIYIVDFIDYNRKVVCEVKPKELLNDNRTQAKISALNEWAKENEFTVELFDLDDIMALPEPANYTLFDEKTKQKLRKLYEKTRN